MAEPVIYWFSNDMVRKGILRYDSATHEEGLDGTDKLTVVGQDCPLKCDRLVWRDPSGTWHEHMVDSTRGEHGARFTSTCSNSIGELFGAYVLDTDERTTVKNHLEYLTEMTNWGVGPCGSFGMVDLEYWHKNVRAIIAELCDLTGGELHTQITVGDDGVTSRKVSIMRARNGNNAVCRQFTWGRNMSKSMREVSQEPVYTAVWAYGAKDDAAMAEGQNSKYAVRDLEVVYADSSNRRKYGYKTQGDSYADCVLLYQDDACTDRAFLRRQAQKMLDAYSKPLVRYEFEITEADGSLWTDLKVGNRVSIVDPDYGDMVERVSFIRRNLKGRSACTVTVGKRANPMVEKFKAQEKAEKKESGNDTRTTAEHGGVTTRGSVGGGGSSGGDGWMHQVDGVEVRTGVVNFITVPLDEYSTPVQTGTSWGTSSHSYEELEYWGTAGNANGH